MSETSETIRLSKLARELNVGISTLIEEAEKKGIKIENNPNTKLSKEVVQVLEKEFAKDKSVKEESKAIGLSSRHRKENVVIEEKPVEVHKEEVKEQPTLHC